MPIASFLAVFLALIMAPNVTQYLDLEARAPREPKPAPGTQTPTKQGQKTPGPADPTERPDRHPDAPVPILAVRMAWVGRGSQPRYLATVRTSLPSVWAQVTQAAHQVRRPPPPPGPPEPTEGAEVTKLGLPHREMPLRCRSFRGVPPQRDRLRETVGRHSHRLGDSP